MAARVKESNLQRGSKHGDEADHVGRCTDRGLERGPWATALVLPRLWGGETLGSDRWAFNHADIGYIGSGGSPGAEPSWI